MSRGIFFLVLLIRDFLTGDVLISDETDEGPTFGASSALSRPTGPNRSLGQNQGRLVSSDHCKLHEQVQGHKGAREFPRSIQ